MAWPRQLQPARPGRIHPDPDLEAFGGRIDPQVPDTTARRLRWWLEVIYIGGFYGIYTLIRNTQGSLRVGQEHAYHNAEKIIRVERMLGLFHEPRIQQFFLISRPFVRSLNIFYGTGHFLVTLAALIWTYTQLPARYPRMRNTLLLTTGLALIGFAFFPLMPPRLFEGYGFVDTLAKYGGSWSFNSGTMQRISNQYAAMPSLHFGWSAWCAISFWPWAKNGKLWRKFVLLAYPTLTTFTIVVTGNHYFLDAIGGFVVLWCGYALAMVLARFNIVDWWRANAKAASPYEP
jgi:PAP2 superfamily